MVAKDGPSQPGAQDPDRIELPLVPLLDTVLFPHMVVPLGVGRERSLRAIEHALAGDQRVLLVAQRAATHDLQAPDELHAVGTIAAVAQLLRMPDGTAQVFVQGLTRARIVTVDQTEPYYRCTAEPIAESSEHSLDGQALMGAVMAAFEEYVKLGKGLPEEIITAARNIDEPGWLADIIAFSPDLTFADRQRLLETFDPVERLRQCAAFLQRQVDLLRIRTQIEKEVQEGVSNQQREYLLREQLKVIQKELGEVNPEANLADEYAGKIAAAELPGEVREKALKEAARLQAMPPGSPEIGIIRGYLDWIVELPWARLTEDRLDLAEAARILDEDHYGLPKVKERLIEYVAVRKLAGERMRTPILCFVGPPGVGKTSLGRSIARALGRQFVRVSLGGIRDEAEIRGHRRTYIGALPGRIIKGMRDAGSRNPVFMLDEIDKVGTDFRGDPAAGLLEVLDPEQNWAFSDHYLEVPFDLSQVIFIATANVLDPVPPALRDRMEVIEIAGYTEDEKLSIARHFLLPKQTVCHGLSQDNLCIGDGALLCLVREYTKEAGVRNLERELASICRKVARRVADNPADLSKIDAADLCALLGPARFSFGLAEERDEVGVATGVAWTQFGGDLLGVEVALVEGKGDLVLTGQLGDVMQESARAAVTYARTRARELNLPASFFETHNIHIHVPAGAIPKDGPSAGITMATALVSALAGRPVRRDVAMTGEITLRGRVLPIGGLKEKVLAAHRGGMTTFAYPKKNEKDLIEIPAQVRDELRLIPVEHMDEVLEVALLGELHLRRRAA
ncbi:MAG: endopeptidase La [Chloroflexi bacterium]|nr:endopeptidase La [Chloroflexota bacterium]